MAYLIESSILMRLANKSDADYATARNAIYTLHNRGESLCSTPQSYVEFRNSATRPTDVNGLGLAPSLVEAYAVDFEAAFPLLPETQEIYPAWKVLVQAASVVGKQVHDARLVAVCHVHAITHILTFNVRHFVRLAGYGPGVIVISPHDV